MLKDLFDLCQNSPDSRDEAKTERKKRTPSSELEDTKVGNLPTMPTMMMRGVVMIL
jgi:hypothetical protein